MKFLERVIGRWRSQRPRYALALAGGGVIGGMYEVGVIAAIEERPNGAGDFDIYVGCSPGPAVASPPANGARAPEIYRTTHPDPDHPPNFRPGAAYPPHPLPPAPG